LAINKPWQQGDDIHPVQDLQLLSKFASSPTSGTLLQGVTQHKTGRMGFKAMEYMEWFTNHSKKCDYQQHIEKAIVFHVTGGINIGTTGYTRVN